MPEPCLPASKLCAAHTLVRHARRWIDPVYRPAFHYAGSINGFQPTSGNTAKLMADAATTHVRLIADIDAAMNHVHVPYYIWLTDGTGTDVAEALIRAADRGVTSRIDLRNHRKITVIDARVTHCGSRNLADPEFLPKKKYAPWVDIMLRFTGPVVAQNQLLFASDWMQATGEGLDPVL